MATHLPDGLSPDAVDTLTELASILTRLRAAQQAAAASTSATGPTIPPTNTSTTSAPAFPPPGSTPAAAATSAPAPGGVTGTTPLPVTTSTPGGSGPGSSFSGTLLSAKDLPAATDNLKHKLQRARAAMRTLGDVRRTTAQQEAEMAELLERRRRQAEMLGQTQADGLRFVKAEEEELEMGAGGGDRMVE